MLSAARSNGSPGPRAVGCMRGVRGWLGVFLMLWLGWLAPAQAQSGGAELASFGVQRGEDGLLLNYAVNFELPRGAEEALNKGPHVLSAIRTLDDILRRMQSHQSKKRPLLRALKAWSSLPEPVEAAEAVPASP